MGLGSDVVFLIDQESLRVLQANRAFSRVLGYTPEEVRTLSLYDLAASDRAVIDAAAAAARQAGELSLGVRPFRRKGGGLVEMEINVGVGELEGRPIFCSVARDLTERQQAEAALRESEERFRAAFQTVPDALTIGDAVDGRYLALNPGFARVSGFTVEEGLGRTALELGMWESPADRQRIQAKLRAQGFLLEEEANFRRRDGTPYTCLISGRFMEAGGKRYYLSVTRDITERKQAEAERERLSSALRQSEKLSAVGQLAGGVAHDFNNQLTAVLGGAEHLVETLTDPAQRLIAQDILVAATRSAELTRKLLAFARKGQMQRTPVDLHALIGEVTSVLARSIDRRITVETRLLAPRARVQGDPTSLQSAILNLALNARDAMPEGGRLLLETAEAMVSAADAATLFELPPGEYLVMAVSDNGTGMTKETQARLFEPFFTTKPLGRGTGMGLASVYGTVRAHAGTVNVYSELGKGSTFRLYLPLAEVGAAPKGRSLEALPVLPTRRVLVVDDEPLVREQLARALTELGHIVTTVTGGRAALERLQQDPAACDLVVLDVVMPDLGGRETFRLLRACRPDLRVVVTSGFALDGDIQAILDEGARAFLQKPFLRAALARAVAEALID